MQQMHKAVSALTAAELLVRDLELVRKARCRLFGWLGCGRADARRGRSRSNDKSALKDLAEI